MPGRKPNVILIVLDTHRVDRLGCYGYSMDTTPNLDSVAQNATLYENAISPAQWTIPSHASMFTGEYPSTHKTIQASDGINPNFRTLAEYALESGYQTIGFCNNPLVGVLDNGFRRGFQKFYNYGGTVPSLPYRDENKTFTFISKLRRNYTKLIDKLATPIQQAVAVSPEVLQIALNPLLVPLWTRYSNFKGDTPSSLKDAAYYINQIDTIKRDDPHFVFMNLMETHLPYIAPQKFVSKFSPIVVEDSRAQTFINKYNTKALQWLLPLDEPYQKRESKTLWSMYDAEVAYQDWLLHELLDELNKPEHLENTILIIVSDHGEMLGEHQIMGHGLGVHEELIHVPMIIRYPGQTQGVRIKQAVSTTQIFHTILNEIGIDDIVTPYKEKISTRKFSLSDSTRSGYVFSESYTPHSLLTILKKYGPDLIDKFHCRSARWAVYNQPYKLIRTQDVQDDLFDYVNDPKETTALSNENQSHLKLATELERFLETASSKSSAHYENSNVEITDSGVSDRLRKLGYID